MRKSALKIKLFIGKMTEVVKVLRKTITLG
jgi:hypothetical protein